MRGRATRGPSDDVAIASLGAELVRDAAGYRVDRVYDFDPDEPSAVPPLARPGVDVVAGDIIESINGVPTLAAEPASLLRGKAGQQGGIGGGIKSADHHRLPFAMCWRCCAMGRLTKLRLQATMIARAGHRHDDSTGRTTTHRYRVDWPGRGAQLC